MDSTIERIGDREQLRPERVEQLSGTRTGATVRARLLAGLPVTERRLQVAGVSTAHAVPTTLIWGRHDRANRLRIAQDASARYGWPLHVIENCVDDPPRDQPLAFMEALRVTPGTESRQQVTA